MSDKMLCPRCTNVLNLISVNNEEGFVFICSKCGYRYTQNTYKLYG